MVEVGHRHARGEGCGSVSHYYIDPRIVADTARERATLAAIRARGLSAHKLHAAGAALRIVGPGVWLTVSALRDVTPFDLEPCRTDAEVRRLQAFVQRAEAPRRRTAATV